MQIPGGGGAGGLLSCAVGCGRGAGGGGGSLATQGDPNFKQKVLPPNSPNNAQAIFQQQTGKGGNGCVGAAGAAARVVEGSAPGRTVFEDGRSDNNFWGVGVRFDGTPLRITGELSAPVGGGGGGGGGDLSYNSDCTIEVTTFANDSSGGGGGGGGGVLIVKALDSIIVGPTGRITADGGNGGGGEQQGSSSRGGGGGGGAGGMVILMSAKEIVINARGSNNKFRYSENDYDFSISADGGACTTLNFVVTNAPIVTQKYQANASGVIDNTYRTTYDLAPLGGFGGMGIVQLMAPAGTNADATNTILDDNIRVLRNGASQDGTAKRDLLAWRGFPTATASFADDFGNPVAIGDSEGDIRPAPILLPAPFGTKTRVRSQWIDTGATRRRPLSALTGDDNLPRGIVLTPGTEAGPRYEFSGTELSGFAKYGIVGSTAKLVYDLAVPHANILTADPTASFLGKPAYRIELVSPSLGSVVDRFSQYDAELLNGAGTVVGSFRILAHTDRELFVSAESGALPANAVSAGVRAKLFRLVTNGVDGAFPTYPGFTGNRVPTCNVKIGFAFHTDPSNPTAARYPTQPGSFAYDLTSQSVQDAVRDLGATFVQWDILFDVGFREQPQDAAPRFSPGTPRPELRDLRLPFRF
jgi:hypothetical protein